MKSIIFLVGCATIPVSSAYPGIDKAPVEIRARGDLVPEVLTAAGQTINGILQQGAPATDSIRGAPYRPPGPLGSAACSADPLCLWHYVAARMWGDFADAGGCTDLARGAIRQGFHDAGAWDVSCRCTGADGSLLLAEGELARGENRGLQAIARRTRAYYDAYRPHGAGMADIIQLGAVVATAACPGGPRIRAFVGRRDSARPAPRGKLPSPDMDAARLVALFARKTFTATELVALVGAHTAARQRFVDPARAGAPLDPDPQVWDAAFYRDVLVGNNRTFFILHSDKSLATHPITRAQWNTFAAAVAGQALWNPAYARAYFRMSMLGVDNLNNLREVSRIIPSR